MIHNWGIRARVTLVAFVPLLVLAALMTATHTTLRLGELDSSLRARAQAYVRQTAVASEYPLFIGGSLEAGQVWRRGQAWRFDRTIFGGSVYTALDTPIGPI